MKLLHTQTSQAIELVEFVDLVSMWHCAGNVPMDRQSMCEFIESDDMARLMDSISMWCTKLNVERPSKSQVVKIMHDLYD